MGCFNIRVITYGLIKYQEQYYMTTQTSINSVSFISANGKAGSAVSYNDISYKKSGTISVSYGSGSIIFSTVTDYLIFVNEAIIPLTNIINSVSAEGTNYVAVIPGTAGSDAVTD